MTTTEECPCLSDEHAYECRAPSPSGDGWMYCTRGAGHAGDHIRCTGGWAIGERHAVERWEND